MHAWCIGTSLAYMSDVQRDCYGVRQSFKTLLHRVVYCRARGENKWCLLPRRAADAEVIAVIRQISGNEFVFQQNSAPAHRAHETIELLRRETRWTLFHRNSGHRTVQILTRWTTKSGLQCSNASTRQRFKMLKNCDSESAECLEQQLATSEMWCWSGGRGI